MGKHAITLFLFCVIFMFACRKEDFISPTLVQAEAIMEEYPDSALQLLNSIQFPEKHSEEDHATWCLLITEARDKNYVEHTSDSVINVAVAYFDKQKDWVRKAQAYYYGGRVNEELAQLEDALAYYLKARSYAKKTTDYHLQGLINMYIGNLQWYLNRQDVALIAHKDAYAYFLADADTLSCGYTLRDIGRVYMASKQADSASFYLRQALTIAEKFVKLSLQASVESDLAILYEEKGEYTKALKYAFLSVNHTPDREKLSSCYLVIGTSFYKMNCLDSAQFYLEQGLSSTQLYTRAGANRALSILYKHQKDYVLSDQYLSDYVYCRDSIEARYDAPKMKELEVRYNNEKAEHEKDRLLQDQKKYAIAVDIVFCSWVICFSWRLFALSKTNKT